MKISKENALKLYMLLWIPMIIVYIWFFMNHDISSTMGFITGSGIVYVAIGAYYWKKGEFELPKKE
ncbi:MAG: hypothetical protein PHX08_21620 [Lachnospiraceae bacterium]|nr:hypothetical protein [Lachnospiraceae bacterium]